MKKKINLKILIAFAFLFIFLGTATAAINWRFTITGGLWNNGSSRNTLEYETDMSKRFIARIIKADTVKGVSGDSGIRVKVISKRYSGIFCTSTQAFEYVNVYANNTIENNNAYFSYDKDASKTKVQWQNWTGNTSFDTVVGASDV